MTVIRYEPWTLMNRLQREIDSLFVEPAATNGAREPRATALVPQVDVHEEAQRYVIRADLPGVAPADIEVTTEQGVLTLRAERRDEKLVAEAGFKRLERTAGTFVRRFTLPDDADAAAISARCQHGVLELTIARAQKSQPRRIAVEAA
jgi:HSP20 family protein